MSTFDKLCRVLERMHKVPPKLVSTDAQGKQIKGTTMTWEDLENWDNLVEVAPHVESIRWLLQAIHRAHRFELISPFKPKIIDVEDEFFLPFRTVVVEEKGKGWCMLVEDELQKGQRGLQSIRRFATISYLTAEQRAEDSDRKDAGPAVGVVCGRIEPSEQEVSLGFGWEAWLAADLLDNHAVGKSMMTEEDQRQLGFSETIMMDMAVCIMDTLCQIHRINDSSHFIVEKRPRRLPKLAKGRIARSHQRPTYTPLTIGEIRRVIPNAGQGPSGDRKKPCPHPRRRHLRTLRSERYRFRRGETIVVPAVWIGPKEAQKGGHIYKVLVEK